jgi:hypothetical protein
MLEAFAEKWREARRLCRPPYAAEMDNVLHAERLRGRAKRLHRRNIDELPDGAFAVFDGRRSPLAATHSCAGRQKVTMLGSRGRAVSLSMCSPRRRSSKSWQLAMNRAGTGAQRISLQASETRSVSAPSPGSIDVSGGHAHP